MLRRLAILGDITTTGGRIITASGQMLSDNQPVALIGDQATCPKCEKGIGIIIEGTGNFVIDGKPASYDTCIVECGCPLGENRIIATKSGMSVDGTNPVRLGAYL